MEIGELVTVPIPSVDATEECPFSHEKPNPQEKNELGGIGSTLGDNMAAGRGIHKTKPPSGGDFTVGDKECDPRDRTGAEKITHIYIKVNDETVALQGSPLPYPLTCAAHHLIPAQESLKGHKILKFMCKDGEDQDFRSAGGKDPAPVAGSVVWGNVAYNVNGCHNGVWLPGNYAVGAGIGAVEVWKARASDQRSTYSDQEAADNWVRALDMGPDVWQPLSIDPKEKEGPQPGALASALASAALPEFMLSGRNYHISPGNPKWGYVKAAMDAVGGQFHDRHEPYSTEVQKYLKKIAESYEQMFDRSIKKEGGCQKCKDAERPDGAKDSLVGPPYDIVGRLLIASNFFKRFVGSKIITARNIYTSKWVLAWLQSPR
jgi:hypothetical protein